MPCLAEAVVVGVANHRKTYGDAVVVADVSFEFDDSEIPVLGP